MMLFDFMEFFSWSLGILCIILWLFVLLPQFIETSRIKSSNAISYSMIILIFLGDSLSTISSSILETNPIIFYTGVFYIIFDIIFILQWFYYNTESDFIDFIINDSDDYVNPYNPINVSDIEFANSRPSTISTTFINKNIYFWKNYPWITDEYHHINKKLFLKLITFISLIIAISILPILINDTIAVILSWLSVISYFVSRIPQIILNFKRRSTHGLSIYTFILIFFANICFILSIIIKSPNDDYILKHLPWLIGSIISILIDIFIFYQFYIYKQKNSILLTNTNSSLTDSFYSIISYSSNETAVNLT